MQYKLVSIIAPGRDKSRRAGAAPDNVDDITRLVNLALVITYCSSTMPVPRHVFEQIKQIIPPLNGKLHKGQSGRVGVLGGALEYVFGLQTDASLNTP